VILKSRGYETENIEHHFFGRECVNTEAFDSEFVSDDVDRSHETSSADPT
jgi:hypothetical protein